MRFANLKISSKISALVALMGLIALCIGGYGGFSVLNVNSVYSYQMQEIVPARIALSRTNIMINGLGYAAYKVMAYPGGSEEAKNAAKETDNFYRQALSTLDLAAAALPGEQAAIVDKKARITDLMRLVNEANEFGLRDDDANAKKSLARLDKEIAALIADIRTMVDVGLRSFKQSSEELTTHSKWTFAALIAISLVSVGAGLGLAIWLTRKMIVNPLDALKARMASLANGDTASPIEGEQRLDEIGDMAQAVAVFRDAAIEKMRLEGLSEEQRQQAAASRAQTEAERQRNADAQAAAAAEQASAMSALQAGLAKLAEGDLQVRLRDGFSEDYAAIRDDFNASIAKLHDAITAIVSATREVSNASGEISSSTTDLSQRTEEQAASLEETSASMEEIAATVKKNAENAQSANQSAIATREVAQRGGAVVAEAVGAMARIEESSRKIADIIGVIDEIARQTNLLALNAAVEAARAGEAGRGFAVVASEVRSLAQRSSQAAKDIKELIVSSGGQVQEGVDLVNRAGSALAEITESIKGVTAIVADIASASAEQSIGIAEVNKALSQMDEATQQNSALVEENAATAKTLESQAKTMDERVSLFRVGGTSTHATAAPAIRRAHAAKPAARPVVRTQGALALRPAADLQEF
ncbi:methyl-accepting chemotaxis protein [Terrarubrum flagellatum]|uniref:methyl-accepting chemotaxis protein n=1 Tax=Terrirubrum flagellatum TaxID=2895980 RepID=UPI003144ED51